MPNDELPFSVYPQESEDDGDADDEDRDATETVVFINDRKPRSR